MATWEEYLKAVEDMKLGKAGGEDTMLAEYLKFGGSGRFGAKGLDTNP